jgi:hypothetical protein
VIGAAVSGAVTIERVNEACPTADGIGRTIIRKTSAVGAQYL